MLVLWHSKKGTAVTVPRDLVNSQIKKKSLSFTAALDCKQWGEAQSPSEKGGLKLTLLPVLVLPSTDGGLTKICALATPVSVPGMALTVSGTLGNYH